MSDINFNSVVTDDNGRVRFSGLRSSIDFEAAIDAMIAARRIPVDRIEANITSNDEKITALREMRTLMNGLKESLSDLYGKVSFGNANDIFQAKTAFATTSRTDSSTPSVAANLIGVTVTNAAAAASHEVEVLQIAKAARIGSGTFSSVTDDLGTASGGAAGSISGSFDINGTTIDVLSTDTLQDLRDRINNANTGSSPTGVTASIVAVSSSQNLLVLTADETGTSITLDNEVGGVLSDLGISNDGGTTLSNELQVAQNAQFYADGLLDTSKYESDDVGSGSAVLSAFGVSGGPHSFDIRDGDGALLGSVSYNDTDTITTLAATIDAIAGVGASVVTDGSEVRLEITGDAGATISVSNDSGGAVAGLGLDRASLLIERSSNTIDDLFSGVTLNLFQAEEGTTIKIDIEEDLTSVKTAITDFVQSYNDLRSFMNQQTAIDPDTGERSDDAGVLFSSTALSEVKSNLTSILGTGAQGVSGAFSVLAQIGIDFVDNGALEDPLLEDTLEINDSELDEALLNNSDDVRKLFGFDFSSSDPQVQLLSFAGTTGYNASGYTLNIGNFGSASELSASVVDNAATLDDGVNSLGATTSGSFNINGTPITYDVTTDTLSSLATAINDAAISGITASVAANGSGDYELTVTSTADPLTIDGDTGDLLAALSFTTQENLVGSANVGGTADGADDGTVTTSGRVLTVTDQSGAEGLKVFYNGNADLSGVSIDFTVGFGASMFFELEQLLENDTGTVDAEIDTLNEQNSSAQDRVDFMLERLDFQRDVLLQRFVRMEETLASLDRVRDSIQQITDAMFADR